MLKVNSQISVKGRVRLSGFVPGVIPEMMSRGLTLDQAIKKARAMGLETQSFETPNLVTSIGKQFIARRITGEELTGLTYLAIGTGVTAPALSDIKLVTESIRKALTECEQGDAYFYSTVFLLAAECSIYIKEGGIFGGASATAAADSGYLLARFLLDFDNSSLQQDLTIQHTGEVL
jgi:hypothetical protein